MVISQVTEINYTILHKINFWGNVRKLVKIVNKIHWPELHQNINLHFFEKCDKVQ